MVYSLLALLLPASELHAAICKAHAICSDAHPFIKSSQVSRIIQSIFACEIGEHLFRNSRTPRNGQRSAELKCR
jgi:hypothetical protein